MMQRLRLVRHLALLAALLGSPVAAQAPAARRSAPAAATPFARLVERLSEAPGFFDSDNLVSNETSYLHVLPALGARGLRGGAYVGVGPEQSFSYIAKVRPEIAILIDIRRDNLLLHLLFKAVFERARSRMEYLCLLYGRPFPPDLPLWTDLPLADLLLYLHDTPADSGTHAANHAELMERVARFGVPLDDEDRATLRRFHDEFAIMGLDLRFTSRGRPPRANYPTVRQLYLLTDLEGKEGSYLSTEDGWRVVRDMERRDRVVPVVGDLAGPAAMKTIGKYLRETRQRVSVFYTSNVEFYLFRQGAFGSFVENVRALPTTPRSVIVRSYFGRSMGNPHPQQAPGHFSVQLLQTVRAFLALAARPEGISYFDLVFAEGVDLKTPAAPRTPPSPRSGTAARPPARGARRRLPRRPGGCPVAAR